MARLFLNSAILPPPGYVGPGDVLGSALFWGGLRAFSNATIGTNAIRIRAGGPTGDNAETDITTLAPDGLLDSATVTSFMATHGGGTPQVFVPILYDQSGNGDNLSNASSTFQTRLLLTGNGILLPHMGNDPITGTGHGPLVGVTGGTTASQPYTISAVYRSFNTSSKVFLNITPSGAIEMTPDFGSVANSINCYAGVSLNIGSGILDNVWHTLQVLCSGVSSGICVDGSTTNGNMGTNGIAGTEALNAWAAFDGGLATEVGVWSGDKSGSFAAMNSNQRTFYGF